MTTIRTQTIDILRLFRNSRNISSKVFRNAIMTAEIAENAFGFRGFVPDNAGVQRSPKSRSWWEGTRCPSKEPLPASINPSGLGIQPFLVGPLKFFYRSATVFCYDYSYICVCFCTGSLWSNRREQGGETSQLDADSLDAGNPVDGAVLRDGDDRHSLENSA